MKQNNTIKCPHCGCELDELTKAITGRCTYYESGRFNLSDLVNYVDDIDNIDDVDELEEQLTHGFWEIDTEDTDYENYDTDEENIECRNCHNILYTSDIAKMIIDSRKNKTNNENLKFLIKNADKLQ